MELKEVCSCRKFDRVLPPRSSRDAVGSTLADPVVSERDDADHEIGRVADRGVRVRRRDHHRDALHLHRANLAGHDPELLPDVAAVRMVRHNVRAKFPGLAARLFFNAERPCE
ncbi:MAG: hypothetical protein WCO99_14310, partial [Planctomycetota bacterium]